MKSENIGNLFYVLFFVLICSCKGPEGDPGPAGNSDKITRIYFPFSTGDVTGSEAGAVNKYTVLYDFNIDHYPGVDSIAFGAYLYSYTPTAKCFVELYDITNQKVIENTLLSLSPSPNLDPVWVTTKTNFLKNLPDKSITLGVRVRSEKEGEGVICSGQTIFIYRK